MPMFASRTSPMPVALALGTALCLLAMAIGLPLDGETAIAIGCAAILALGLPHGTLDVDLFKQAQPGIPRSVILFLYIGFASAMAGVWLASPAVAFAVFYLLAVAHFGEDWTRTGSEFLAQGIALALLAIPALTHRVELTNLFAALTGSGISMIIVDLLRLVAPVATMVALVAIGLLWNIGVRDDALGAGLALAGMAILPPVVGFALFFCLFHSPRHLGAGRATLSLRRGMSGSKTSVVLTLAAAGIAAIVYTLSVRSSASDRLLTASFITLSILTLPHMAVPIVLRLVRRTGPGSPASAISLPSRYFAKNANANAARGVSDG